MQVNLVFFKTNGQRKEVPLPSGVFTIGRAINCAIRIPLLGVSREHCRITVAERQVSLKDLDSSNGTFINGERVIEQAMQPGDLLQIASIIFTAQIDGKPAEIEAPPIVSVQMTDGDALVELTPEDTEDGFAQLIADDEDADPIKALEALADDTEEPSS